MPSLAGTWMCTLLALSWVHAHAQYPLLDRLPGSELLSSDDEYLSLTAVTSDPMSPDARLECWQFLRPFAKYPTVGKALALADVDNVTYVVLPPRGDEGFHHPPAPMLFVLISGLACVIAPNSTEHLWISQHENQVVVANDMAGAGHVTKYPLNEPSIALQLPFKRGKVPDYRVLHSGPCR